MAAEADRNRAIFNTEIDNYMDLALKPGEFELLRLYQHRWLETDMLDLGVGSGRTALTFARLARSYVGIDYAPRMIEACRQRVGESETETVKFLVCDATNLSELYGRKFDLILFSFNGIDCVHHEQRLQVLGEIRTLLKPDGRFFFSAHSLDIFPFPLRLTRKGNVSLARRLYRCWRETMVYVRRKWHNRKIDVAAARERGWVILVDGEHDFTARFYYITPEHQVKQLAEHGFETLAVYDIDGQPIDYRTPPVQFWMYYLCRPTVDGRHG
jgi:SAM-dependent methyltransferase